jgi:uncharacterized delta-60 repeat protein
MALVAFATFDGTVGRIFLRGRLRADRHRLRLACGAAAITAIVSTASALAVPGDLDPGFSGGKVTTKFDVFDPFQTRANAVAIQADGKIVAVGKAGGVSLARYNPDGTLDDSFGSGGKVTTGHVPDGNLSEGLDVAIQPSDQKIVVAGVGAGTAYPNSDDFAVLRYNPDGSLDTSFGGGDGAVFTQFVTPSLDANTLDEDKAEAVAIQPDGDIVAAGTADPDADREEQDFAVARYNPDGSLDNAFGGDGRATHNFGTASLDFGHDLALLPGNRVIVVGKAKADAALVQFGSDGELDTAFNNGGSAVINQFGAQLFGVARQADGKIVAAGTAPSPDGDDVFEVLRLNADGTFDAGFDKNGIATSTFGGVQEAWNDVAIAENGDIVTVGDTFDGFKDLFAIGRFLPSGKPDPLFSCDGATTTAGSDDRATALGLALDAHGDIVAAGVNEGQSENSFLLARYLSGGPDPDCVAPTTTIKGPTKTTKRRPTFKFGSNEPGSTFKCKLDKDRKYLPCEPKYKPAEALRFGKHHLYVSAVDQAGNVEDPPAMKAFTILRKGK